MCEDPNLPGTRSRSRCEEDVCTEAEAETLMSETIMSVMVIVENNRFPV